MSKSDAAYAPLPVREKERDRDEAVLEVQEAPSPLPPPPPPDAFKVFLSVAFYMSAALTMVMVNKLVLNAVDVPLFFLGLQLALAVVCLHICAWLRLFNFEVPTLDKTTVTQLLPLAGVNVMGLALNTLCLAFVDASFYQVARGMLLPFTVALSFFILQQRPSRDVLLAVGVVCSGFLIGVASQRAMNLSVFGVFLGACSSFFSSLHAIYVKRYLPVVDNKALSMAYFSNFLSAGLLIPLILFFETGGIIELMSSGSEALRTFVIGSLVTGFVGFLICVAGYISIQVTSPTTHMISSACRGVIQTALGVLIFNDKITTGRLSSILVILVGSVQYTYIRGRENKRDAERRKSNNALPMQRNGIAMAQK